MSGDFQWGATPAVHEAGTVRLIAYDHAPEYGAQVLDIQEYSLPEDPAKRKRLMRDRVWDMLEQPCCHRVEIQFLPKA